MAAGRAAEAAGLIARYHAAPDDSALQECIIAEYEELTGIAWEDRPGGPLGVGDTSRLIGDTLSMSEDQRIAAKESISKLACALDMAALDYLGCGAQVGLDTGIGPVAGVAAAMDKLTDQQAAAIAGLAVMNAYSGMPREHWGYVKDAAEAVPVLP